MAKQGETRHLNILHALVSHCQTYP